MNLTHIYFLLIEKSWQTTNLQTGKMETTWDVFLTMIPLTCDMESHVISSLPSDLWQSSRPVWRTKKTWKQLVATKPPNFNKPRRVVGEKNSIFFLCGEFWTIFIFVGRFQTSKVFLKQNNCLQDAIVSVLWKHRYFTLPWCPTNGEVEGRLRVGRHGSAVRK